MFFFLHIPTTLPFRRIICKNLWNNYHQPQLKALLHHFLSISIFHFSPQRSCHGNPHQASVSVPACPNLVRVISTSFWQFTLSLPSSMPTLTAYQRQPYIFTDIKPLRVGPTSARECCPIGTYVWIRFATRYYKSNMAYK